MNSEHVEYHRLDAVQANGELVSRLEQHASADAVGSEKPHVHAEAQLDVPSEGVHRVLVQDGSHVSVHDASAVTTPANEEVTTKVFHGAARLVQPGQATNVPTGPHTAVRRAFNADITKETKNNMDHYAAYSGVQYSPLDMAEYVFWTGDERGVTTAIETFLQEGMMTKEDAIAFLQEIKFNIDYLRAHYSQNLKAAEESAQQEKLRNMLIEQAEAKEYQYRSPALQSFPFGSSPDIIRSIANKNWELSNNLSPVPALPVSSELRPEAIKRTYDPMLTNSMLPGVPEYEREPQGFPDEEYEEIMDKLKPTNIPYNEYTLEEIIYQLAKMMFSQSLSRDPASARSATRRFMSFLEVQAERGQLSRTIEKKVLDLMIAALTDTISDHPELLLMGHFYENRAAKPNLSREILTTYKNELLKPQPLHTFNYQETM
uniref:SFRICE_001635 n=1 Tax=Spodoptera frugiperda TaxID=7108 RepID=A0A2H1V6F9_SPOFR